MEKGGKVLPVSARGSYCTLAAQTWVNHDVGMAKLVVEKCILPLIISGHSFGGMAIAKATDRIAEVCDQNGASFVMALYLAPAIYPVGPEAKIGIPLPCCRCICAGCWVCCCCNFCGVLVCPMPDQGLNPEKSSAPTSTRKL